MAERHMLLPGAVWRHRVKGADYTIVATSTGQGGDIEMQPVVIYRGADGQVWVRTVAEFVARFACQSEPQPPLASTSEPL